VEIRRPTRAIVTDFSVVDNSVEKSRACLKNRTFATAGLLKSLG
jgi:hypothetical protein